MPPVDWERLPHMGELTSGGVTLACRRIGDAGAPPALALHGGPGLDHHLLLPLVARLPELQWLVPDLPAHGASPFPSSPVTLRWVEERLARWAGHLDPAPLVLVAHSFGSWLAKDLLRRKTIAPRVAVLLAPPVSHGGGEARSRAPSPLSDESGRTPLEALRRQIRSESGAVADELDAALSRATLRPAREYGSLIRGLARALAGPPRGIPASVPLLVVCGSEDRTTPLHEAIVLVNLSEGACLETLDGAGHWALAERPDELARLIRDFLRGRAVVTERSGPP